MNIKEILVAAFPPDQSDLEVKEKYTSLELCYSVSSLNKFSSPRITELFNFVPERDSLFLSVWMDGNDPVTISKIQELDDFLFRIEEEKRYHEDEEIFLKAIINKTTSGGIISIYDFDAFEDFVKGLDTYAFLNIIREDLANSSFLHFKTLEETDIRIKAGKIFVGSEDFNSGSERKINLTQLRDHCHFADINTYPFVPNFFDIKSTSEGVKSFFSDKLDKLSFIFAITGIFDITSIKDNQFVYKLNGYKTFEGALDLNSLDTRSKNSYIKIFDWIYVESGGIADKVGLARNILSIYLKEGSLEISDSVFFSIQSGFKTYLQVNLNRYIEVRSKISSELVELTSKASKVIDSYLSSYQKSNFSFISFFVSVFILRVISKGDFQNVFTRDATIISFSLLFLSVLYLLFSFWNLNGEKERLRKRYSNLKNRFKDLLIEEDINKILRNDQEFNDEMAFISQRQKAYSFLWALTIIAFLIAILSVSSVYNWQFLIENLNNLFLFLFSINPTVVIEC